LPELIDHAASSGIDMGELALEDESANDKVVVRMHVVTAAGAVKDLIAEDANRPKTRTPALIVMEVEAGRASHKSVGMPGDVGRS
jgi:hypothetical protein